jgi:hypothetical protein
MPTSANDLRPRARRVSVSDAALTVGLADGRVVSAPLAWFRRLMQATTTERDAWEILGDGEAIHWPAIDEDVSVIGLLAGRRP